MVFFQIEVGELVNGWSIWRHSIHIVLPKAMIGREAVCELSEEVSEIPIGGQHSFFFSVDDGISNNGVDELIFLALLHDAVDHSGFTSSEGAILKFAPYLCLSVSDDYRPGRLRFYDSQVDMDIVRVGMDSPYPDGGAFQLLFSSILATDRRVHSMSLLRSIVRVSGS